MVLWTKKVCCAQEINVSNMLIIPDGIHGYFFYQGKKETFSSLFHLLEKRFSSFAALQRSPALYVNQNRFLQLLRDSNYIPSHLSGTWFEKVKEATQARLFTPAFAAPRISLRPKPRKMPATLLYSAGIETLGLLTSRYQLGESRYLASFIPTQNSMESTTYYRWANKYLLTTRSRVDIHSSYMKDLLKNQDHCIQPSDSLSVPTHHTRYFEERNRNIMSTLASLKQRCWFRVRELEERSKEQLLKNSNYFYRKRKDHFFLRTNLAIHSFSWSRKEKDTSYSLLAKKQKEKDAFQQGSSLPFSPFSGENQKVLQNKREHFASRHSNFGKKRDRKEYTSKKPFHMNKNRNTNATSKAEWPRSTFRQKGKKDYTKPFFSSFKKGRNGKRNYEKKTWHKH